MCVCVYVCVIVVCCTSAKAIVAEIVVCLVVDMFMLFTVSVLVLPR